MNWQRGREVYPSTHFLPKERARTYPGLFFFQYEWQIKTCILKFQKAVANQTEKFFRKSEILFFFPHRRLASPRRHASMSSGSSGQIQPPMCAYASHGSHAHAGWGLTETCTQRFRVRKRESSVLTGCRGLWKRRVKQKRQQSAPGSFLL